MIRNKRGITLIALIITIIVLLILAGVVINFTVGKNGIIGKAQTAVGKYENAQEKEKEEISKLDNEISLKIDGNSRNIPEGYIKPEGTVKINESREKFDVSNFKYADTSDMHLKSEDIFNILETGTFTSTTVAGGKYAEQTINLKNTYTESQNAYLVFYGVTKSGDITPYIDTLNGSNYGIGWTINGNIKKFFLYNGSGSEYVPGSISFNYAIIQVRT